uniref:Uncharacterized protein n=1 Tax=Oryza sativa subsp. japonica TaxID=39947 RepID=Q6ZG65_ORYSJ|nr:hypothetical protein [Oryza sativa Japonica Group]
MSWVTDGTSTTRMNGDDDDGPRRGLDGGEAMPRKMSPARRCDSGGGGGAADGARVEEGPTGEIPARRMERPAWHGGVPAKFGRRRGLAEEEDGVPVPGEVVATTADAQETRQRRNSGSNATVAGEDALPEVSAGNGEHAGEGEATATPGEAMARPAG